MAAIDQLTGLVNVIEAVKGKESKGTTTTSGTTTQQTNISDQGVQQLIQGILAGPGGVRSIGGAARRSGLYNSSTEDMLLGDLYSRAANQAELARSPTTTTTNQTQTSMMQQGGIGMGSLGSLIGGGMLLNSLFGGATGKSGIAGLLGGGGGAGGIGETISGLLGGGGTAAASGGLQAGAGGIGGLASSLGPESVKMLSGAGGATAGAGGMLSSLGGALPLGGAFLGGLLGGMGEGSAKTEDYAGSLASGALAGFSAGGPMGALAGGLLGALGVGASDMSVICTALNKRGLISDELYVEGHKHLAGMDQEVKMGYYIWATPIADKINEGSRFWRYAMVVPTWCYLTLMASDRGILDYLENPIGAVLKLVGEPACKLLFRTKLFFKMHTSRI